MTRLIDEEPQQPERSPELQAAIRKFVGEVHDLLDGPVGRGQLDGDMDMQKVILTLPRAYVELAAFLAVVDEEQQDPLNFWNYVKTTPEDSRAEKRLNRLRNLYLERTLDQAMSLTLHLLATEALQLTGKRGL
ncbi:hypothetical protein SAMN04490244_107151 [Tranquillimonas rosea]|uniref:Uncharacterized protein n=1 Tax=Tranquillimonas rosea TaxID=641238 RepID=A0A1H9VIM5_9RHOB|nr:hypothetical protein [Tranquillimonas rosea]SES21565.1 hypothetical protein SAMN04490244_107151 [Tranquillimonas rosea]